jgi:hypothetical protein
VPALRNLSKSYVAGTPVLQDVDLEVAARDHCDHRCVGHGQIDDPLHHARRTDVR